MSLMNLTAVELGKKIKNKEVDLETCAPSFLAIFNS